MIENYFVFAEALKNIKRNTAFIFLGISALLDLLCSVSIRINHWVALPFDVIWLRYFRIFAIILFLVFCYWYYVSKNDSFKYKKIYLFILVVLCLVSALLYIIWMCSDNILIQKIHQSVYCSYTLGRLIFILHYSKLSQSKWQPQEPFGATRGRQTVTCYSKWRGLLASAELRGDVGIAPYD